MGDNYKNNQNQPQATPLWTAEKQIMQAAEAEKASSASKTPKTTKCSKSKKPKKPFNKLWLVIPLCLALIAGIVLCAYFAFFNSKGDDDTEESSAVTDSSEVLEGKGFNWMLENGILTITGIGPMPNFTVESPAPWMTAGEITAVVISNGITSIGDFAFYECEDVTSVTIPSTVITIGKGAFEDCNSLESITVPEGVASIDDGAFAGSGLTSVTIPSTVTDMGSDLFNHCAELISIVYNGTKEQWDAIEKDDTWQGNAPIKTVHCNDTAFDPQNPDAVLEYDAEGTTDKGLTWTLLDGTLTISGEGEMDDFEVEGDYATPIYWQAYPENIKAVVIQEGVTSVGCAAFYNCENLANTTLSTSIKTINYGAFYDCAFTNFVIPEGMEVIGEGAFAGCESLKTVTLSSSVESIGFGAFYHCEALTVINVPTDNKSYTVVNGVLFTKDMKSLVLTPAGSPQSAYIVPNGVKNIKFGAFSCCYSLSTITIPNSVVNIEGSAFAQCQLLESFNYNGTVEQWKKVNLEEGVDQEWNSGASFTVVHCTDGDVDLVEYDAKGVTNNGLTWTLLDGTLTISGKGDMDDLNEYYGMPVPSYWHNYSPDIKNVIINDGITSIGDLAFHYCKSIVSISIPNSVKSIGAAAFYCCESLKTITIPSSVKSIRASAFSGCTSLEIINGGGGVEIVERNLFSQNLYDKPFYFTNTNNWQNGALYLGKCLIKVREDVSGSYTIKEGTTCVGPEAFYGCNFITSITIPNSVTIIGESAFSGCTSLTSITIGNSVTSIGRDAFSGCVSLKSISIPSSVTSVGSNAFSNTGIYNDAKNWYNNALYVDGVLTQTKEGISGEFTVKAGTKIIADYAFNWQENITSINIPADVKYIGYTVFGGCSSLTSITVAADNNSYISSNGVLFTKDKKKLIKFPQNKAASTYSIPNTVEVICADAFSGVSFTSMTVSGNVNTIESYAFSGCLKLKSVVIGGKVKNIGYCAFSSCEELTTLTLPVCLEYIATEAFGWCYKLTTVNYGGTVAQWKENEPNFGIDWCRYTAIQDVNCSDGKA